YGIWVRDGEIELRGYVSRRVIPSHAITRLVVDRSSARLEIVAGRAWASAFLGLRGWKRQKQDLVIGRIAAWAERESLSTPEVFPSGGYSSLKEAICGPLLGLSRFPRVPAKPSPVSLVVATVLGVGITILGLWLQT